MGPAFKIAWRYFRGKKSAQAINIISWISIGAIAVSSAAMIVLFSVFNGLEDTVKGMYYAFNPEIKVTAEKGKFFAVTNDQLQRIRRIPGVAIASLTLEDMVLLTGDEEQRVGKLKGVDDNWFKVSHLDSFMTDGEASWPQHGSYTPAIMGLGVSIALGIDVNNAFSGLHIYYPKQGIPASDDPEAGLNNIVVKPQGNFRIQDEFDGEYVLVPLAAASHLFGVGDRVSSVEIALKPGTGEGDIRQGLYTVLGNNITIENRFEQNKTFYMIMRSEKWAVYAILLMVLLIASFNMIGSLSMVVLEKKKDIAILKSMGARRTLVHSVFLIEGGLLALLGAFIGVLTGLLLCLGQHYYGWISLPDGFIINAYPVLLQAQDFVLVIVTALAVGLLAAWYPAYKASRQAIYVREE
ncbi:FtsX-like permease family protein [Taibaiella koreensis]|uniref:FtsX-like permease family protein n=1 Tax=Taibaiella koreensis TaxID=1268548 RepID=UPI000E599BD0|nr:FtsX-like permease family protein [Taibaiella koreensis]